MKKRGSHPKKNMASGAVEASASIVNAVRATRKARGMGQGELAEQVGLTRQAMYAIEGNHYLPSTAIALRLAQVLGCQVEDLFRLSTKGEVIEAEWVGEEGLGSQALRVNVAQIGDRTIARPLSELGDMLNFVVSADGLATKVLSQRKGRISQRVLVELLHDRKQIAQHVVIAGCDPSLFIAGGYIRQLPEMARIMNWTMGSAKALRALLDGEVHIAGVHLVDARSGECNIPYLKRHVKGKDYLGIRFASWVQGIIVTAGNPKQIRSIEDLGRADMRLVNREAGAGARFFLDTLLKKAGIVGRQLNGYDHEVSSHLEIARLIRDGLADVGIGVESAARHYGLDFIPLREEQYDLILRKSMLASHPMIDRLLDAMVSRPFRLELEALGGYDLADIGTSLSW